MGEGQWGYQCCFSLIQNSYCTGETGKSINAPPAEKLAIAPATTNTKRVDPNGDEYNRDDDDDDDDDPMRNVRKKVVPEKTEEELEEERQARIESEKRRQKKRDRKRKKKEDRKKRKERKSRKSSSSSSESDDSDSEKKKKKKLAKALKAEEERVKQVNSLMKMDERKRPHNSMNIVEAVPDEAEMEAYHMKRQRDEDPMAFFM